MKVQKLRKMRNRRNEQKCNLSTIKVDLNITDNYIIDTKGFQLELRYTCHYNVINIIYIKHYNYPGIIIIKSPLLRLINIPDLECKYVQI